MARVHDAKKDVAGANDLTAKLGKLPLPGSESELQNIDIPLALAIARYQEDRFIGKYSQVLKGLGARLYAMARRIAAAHEHDALIKAVSAVAPGVEKQAGRSINELPLSFHRLFDEDSGSQCAPEAIEAASSPAVYCMALLQEVQMLESHNKPGLELDATQFAKRRPDLLQVPLSGDQLKRSESALTYVNELLESSFVKPEGIGSKASLYETLSNSFYPLHGLPLHLPFAQVTLGLKEKKTSLGEIVRQMDSAVPFSNSAQASRKAAMMAYLELSPSQLALLQSGDHHDTSSFELSRMQISAFCRAASLTKADFEQMLCLGDFALEEKSFGYGTHFIRGGEKEIIHTGDPDNIHYTADQLSRMIKMIQLQRWLQLPFDQLDTLLHYFNQRASTEEEPTISTEALEALGLFRYLNRQYQVSLDVFTVLVGGWLPTQAQGRAVSLFDRVFNPPGRFDTKLTPAQLPVSLAALEDCSTEVRAQICAGLGVSFASLKASKASFDQSGGKPSEPDVPDLRLLSDLPNLYVQELISEKSRVQTPPSTLANRAVSGTDLAFFSKIYGEIVRFKIFGLTFEEGLTLSKWMQRGGFESCDAILALDSAVQWLKQQQLTVAALQPLLSSEIPPLVSTTPIIKFFTTLAEGHPQQLLKDESGAQSANQDAAVRPAIAQFCGVSLDLVPCLLSWTGASAKELLELGSQFDAKDPKLLQQAIMLIYPLVRAGSVTTTFGLSAAGASAWEAHPQWFGSSHDGHGLASLCLEDLYLISQYKELLSKTTGTEEQLLSCLEKSPTPQKSWQEVVRFLNDSGKSESELMAYLNVHKGANTPLRLKEIAALLGLNEWLTPGLWQGGQKETESIGQAIKAGCTELTSVYDYFLKKDADTLKSKSLALEISSVEYKVRDLEFKISEKETPAQFLFGHFGGVSIYTLKEKSLSLGKRRKDLSAELEALNTKIANDINSERGQQHELVAKRLVALDRQMITLEISPYSLPHLTRLKRLQTYSQQTNLSEVTLHQIAECVLHSERPYSTWQTLGNEVVASFHQAKGTSLSR